jgi:two-component sensor histidine kinase
MAHRDEASHRFANQLSMIATTIHLRAASVAKGPAYVPRSDVMSALNAILGRLVSLGELNRCLSQAGSDSTDVQKCLVETCSSLINALSLEGRVSVVHRFNANCRIAATQAQALALLINEIIINAIKHAHPTGLSIAITLSCDKGPDGRIAIEIADDGIGLPEGFDTDKDGGVGFRVIRTLTQTLGAQLEIESDSLGLAFRFHLAAVAEPVDEPQAPRLHVVV